MRSYDLFRKLEKLERQGKTDPSYLLRFEVKPGVLREITKVRVDHETGFVILSRRTR